MSNKLSGRLVFGPSHCARLKHAIATGQLPELSIPSRIVGVGGMPIWSPRIHNEIAASILDQDVFFIVGDFRFGNVVLNDPTFKPEGRQEKEYLSIDKALINEKNDAILYGVCLAALELLNLQLNGRLRLLFWDLSIREYQNRATGNYQHSGVYRHPIWNLADTLEQFADIAIDTRDILDYGERLYIDSSAHPSLLGWVYITHYLHGNADVKLTEVMRIVDKSLQNLLDTIFSKDALLITGDSKFTRLLNSFVKKQQFQLPANWVIHPLAKATEVDAFDHCLYFPGLCTFDKNESEVSEGIKTVLNIRNRLALKHKKVSILYYDNWAYESISKRSGYLNQYICKHSGGLTSNLETLTCFENQSYKISDSLEFDGMIELNATLIPTISGIVEILCRSTTEMTHQQIRQAYSDFINACYG